MTERTDIAALTSLLRAKARSDGHLEWQIDARDWLIQVDATTLESASDPDAGYKLGKQLYDEILETAGGIPSLDAVNQICAVTVTDNPDISVAWSGGVRIRFKG
ncbi:hypothetical protein [Amycolatopsis sp. CA-230715]|uniref:hypothetical protein n=1 Tax=Amycolatopsis sp. CA-230715 TaxID=2745196 RepID=UPI001C016118|nr:hypothetical protein [Amycolatopsis sp. CA-230715]